MKERGERGDRLGLGGKKEGGRGRVRVAERRGVEGRKVFTVHIQRCLGAWFYSGTTEYSMVTELS